MYLRVLVYNLNFFSLRKKIYLHHGHLYIIQFLSINYCIFTSTTILIYFLQMYVNILLIFLTCTLLQRCSTTKRGTNKGAKLISDTSHKGTPEDSHLQSLRGSVMIWLINVWFGVRSKVISLHSTVKFSGFRKLISIYF